MNIYDPLIAPGFFQLGDKTYLRYQPQSKMHEFSSVDCFDVCAAAGAGGYFFAAKGSFIYVFDGQTLKTKLNLGFQINDISSTLDGQFIAVSTSCADIIFLRHACDLIRVFQAPTSTRHVVIASLPTVCNKQFQLPVAVVTREQIKQYTIEVELFESLSSKPLVLDMNCSLVQTVNVDSHYKNIIVLNEKQIQVKNQTFENSKQVRNHFDPLLFNGQQLQQLGQIRANTEYLVVNDFVIRHCLGNVQQSATYLQKSNVVEIIDAYGLKKTITEDILHILVRIQNTAYHMKVMLELNVVLQNLQEVQTNCVSIMQYKKQLIAISPTQLKFISFSTFEINKITNQLNAMGERTTLALTGSEQLETIQMEPIVFEQTKATKDDRLQELLEAVRRK